MMWRSTYWITAALVSALAASFVSKQVSDTRKAMVSAQRHIAADTQEIARLRSELTARARPERLEALNASVLGLGAPSADRYFASVDALVAFAGRDVPMVREATATGVDARPSVRLAAAGPLVDMHHPVTDARPHLVAAPAHPLDAPRPRVIASTPVDNAALDAMLVRLDAQQ